MDWLSLLGWKAEEVDSIRAAGFAYVRQGAYDLALTFFEALEVLDPGNAYHLQTLGALYLQTGNGLRALDALDKALKIEPAHQETLLNRAKTLCMLGYKRQGLQIATALQKSDTPYIASQASALILAYAQSAS
jgi:tetratricopeptide (TPR) repeat protein